MSLVPLLLVACAGPAPTTPWVWDLPPGFPEPVVPADNPLTVEKVTLGERLFDDVRISVSGTYACTSCHFRELGYTNGASRGVGLDGEPTLRSPMALANAGWASVLTWADPSNLTLEDQAHRTFYLEDPVEIGMAGGESTILARLAEDEDLVAMFAAAFPDEADPLSPDTMVRAIASYQRVMVSGASPYDRWVGGDADALSESQLRGHALFTSARTNCAACHGGFLFSDATRSADDPDAPPVYHNTGLYNVDGAGAYPERDPGLYAHTGDPADMGKFKAPSLRNCWVTSPYMHDGSIATLDDVLDHYAAGGRTIDYGIDAGVGADSPLKDPLVTGFTLTTAERADLLAFLAALTDMDFVGYQP